VSVKSESKPVPSSRAAVSLAFTAVFFLLACSLAVAMGSKPSDVDYSTTRLSDKGVYKVTFFSLSDPLPLNKIHSWRLHVEKADGGPLEEAAIQVAGGMPQHGHGLPTQPQVTENLGGGDYLVEGMKFQMPGWWVVRLSISSGGTTDQVTFNLQL